MPTTPLPYQSARFTNLSSSHVRDRWLALLIDGDESAVLDWLNSRPVTRAASLAGPARNLAEALAAGDRRAEAAAWRQLECATPYGFPSEIPLYAWRFDPTTGQPLTRYETLTG